MTAAGVTELSDDAVTVIVMINPIECVIDCGGPLPPTGLELPIVALLLGAALLAAGVVFAVRARATRRHLPCDSPSL